MSESSVDHLELTEGCDLTIDEKRVFLAIFYDDNFAKLKLSKNKKELNLYRSALDKVCSKLYSPNKKEV